jgi:hypothetical protein
MKSLESVASVTSLVIQLVGCVCVSCIVFGGLLFIVITSGEMGLLGITAPSEYGGLDLGKHNNQHTKHR